MRLDDSEWKELKISDLFDISGTITTHPSKLIINGKTPRITCAATNNALDGFYLNKSTEKGKVITIDSATIGYISYQYSNFIATDHVEKITLKNRELNKYLGLSFVNMINNSIKNKYSYGYKFSQFRIAKQKILLPTKNDQLDYQFMENYTKSLYQKKLQKYINYIKKQLSKIEYKEIPKLQEKKWKEFFIIDIFPNIQRGKRLTKTKQTKGNIPYVSSTAQNNGVDNFIGNLEKVRIFEDCLTIANSGSVGATFYHSYKFVASDHVTHLKNEKFNSFIYLFISTLTKRLSTKYNFNREINDFRISRDKILLPINDKNKLDYEYMEQYIKNLMFKKINQYLKFVEKKKESFSD